MATRKLRVSEDLSLPLDWITTSTVVYGARGAGKTTLGSVIAEEVYDAGLRFCAVDLKGDWWGLKSSADGNHSGIPVVIFGGDHADLPLEADAGTEVANVIASLEQSTIIDLEHLSKTKQLRFLAAFFERLYDANRNPLLLMLDEAQRYAPQRPMSPDATICLGAVEDLVKLGRKHGIGPMLFTQRGSGLNKEVSELCDMLVAFRTPGALDQDRVKDWLGANAGKAVAAELLGMISGLPTGTAIIATNHPQLRDSLPSVATPIVVRPRRTFDSSATPKVGQRRREPKILAQPEIEALKGRMSEAIERAKAEDPKELRKAIAYLTAENTRLLNERRVEPKTVERIVERVVEVPVIDEEAVNKIGSELSAASGAISIAMQTLADLVSTATERATGEKREPAQIIPIRPPTSEDRIERDLQRSIRRAKPDAKPGFQSDGSFVYELQKTERAILSVLAQYQQGRSKQQIAMIAGYSPTSGAYGQAFANLRKLGAIEGTSALHTITPLGREALGDDVEPLPSGEALREYWISKRPKQEGLILRELCAVYPDSLSKAEIAERLGYSEGSGAFGQAFANLRKLDIIEGGASAYYASGDLFQ